MKYEETAGRLVIRDDPTLFWGCASLFFCSGSACLYLAWSTTPNLAAGAIVSVIGLAHLAGGSYLLRSEPASTVEIDVRTGRVHILRRSPFGRRIEDLLISSVAGAEVEAGEHTDGGPVYRPSLRLHSGESTQVSIFWYQQEGPSASIAERINCFIGSRGFDKT